LVIIDYGRAIALDTPENLKSTLARDFITLKTKPPILNPVEFFSSFGIQEFSRPGAETLRLELANAESLVGDLVSLIKKDHQIESLRIARPTLDDVFLHYTGRGLRE
jgi:ABC-2 type transport system ATP-binding protein